jgi:hypothetical protein
MCAVSTRVCMENRPQLGALVERQCTGGESNPGRPGATWLLYGQSISTAHLERKNSGAVKTINEVIVSDVILMRRGDSPVASSWK